MTRREDILASELMYDALTAVAGKRGVQGPPWPLTVSLTLPETPPTDGTPFDVEVSLTWRGGVPTLADNLAIQILDATNNIAISGGALWLGTNPQTIECTITPAGLTEVLAVVYQWDDTQYEAAHTDPVADALEAQTGVPASIRHTIDVQAVPAGDFNEDAANIIAAFYAMPAYLYQDVGVETTPVVADGDPVGAWVPIEAGLSGVSLLTSTAFARKMMYDASVTPPGVKIFDQVVDGMRADPFYDSAGNGNNFTWYAVLYLLTNVTSGSPVIDYPIFWGDASASLLSLARNDNGVDAPNFVATWRYGPTRGGVTRTVVPAPDGLLGAVLLCGTCSATATKFFLDNMTDAGVAGTDLGVDMQTTTPSTITDRLHIGNPGIGNGPHDPIAALRFYKSAHNEASRLAVKAELETALGITL